MKLKTHVFFYTNFWRSFKEKKNKDIKKKKEQYLLLVQKILTLSIFIPFPYKEQKRS